MHTILCEYLEREMNDKANRKAVRTKCEDLLERLRDPKFLLYLFQICMEVKMKCVSWVKNSMATGEKFRITVI